MVELGLLSPLLTSGLMALHAFQSTAVARASVDKNPQY